MTIEERKAAAQQPVHWTGDFSDDCMAEWAGLLLRAERMDEGHWWWAVYDLQREEFLVGDSNDYQESFATGEDTRTKAESAAANYLDILSREIMGKYFIQETFEITGRGLVLAGHLQEGHVSPGDIFEFTLMDTLRQRRVLGVQFPNAKGDTGLLIECKRRSEISELKKWSPNSTSANIYKKPD